MANEYEAKLDIDTSQATAGLKAVDKSVENLDRTLKSLDGSLKSMQSTLSATARAMQDSNKAQRESATSADRSAAAAIKDARARELQSKAALNAARTEAVQRRERDASTRANESAANSYQAVTGAVRGYSQSANEATNANAALSGSMSNTRYLLYDIGATYSAISIGLLAIPTATTAVAASFQKDFAQVQRTTLETGAASDALREDLMNLAEAIPLAFGDLTKIAALGAQLGVPTEALAEFTDVVAKFSASTGVAAEEAGAAFGRIGSAFNLHEEDYNNLGSAIAEVGVSSAATETEIIAITQQLAPLASLAGFSAQEVVGLSGALASMRIRPELARGAFQSTIFKITAATENGGKSLQAYADIMGITGDQVKNLYKTNPAQFFQDYITGIGQAMEGGRTFSEILDGLGVKEKRERQFILAMANQYGFLGKQIELANKSYDAGTFLDKSSAIVFQTLAANLQKLSNSFANLGATLGGASLGPLTQLVEILASGTQAITDFIKVTPGMKEVLGVLLGYGAVVGIFFAVRSAMAFVLAAMVGFQQVASKSALATTFSLKGIAAQAAVTRLVTQGATSQMAGDYVRLAGTAKAMSAQVVAANGAMGASITNTGGKFKGFANLALSAVGGLPGIIVGVLAALGVGMVDAANKAEAAGKRISEAFAQSKADGLQAIAEQLSEVKAGMDTSGLAFEVYGKSIKELGERGGLSLEQMVTAISKGKDAAQELAPILDEIAKKRGYDNFQQFSDLNTDAAGLIAVRNKVAQLGSEYAKTSQNTADTKDVVKKLGAEGAEAMVELEGGAEGAASGLAKLDQNIKDAVESIFGLQNAESAASAALYNLGKSLAESRDLSIDTAGGRDNLQNAQQAVSKYAEALARAQQDGKTTAEQAAADYASYIDGLFNELIARGVDPSQAAQFIEMAKGVMSATAASGTPVTVPVTVNAEQARSEGVKAGAGIDVGLSEYGPTVVIDSDTTQATAAVAGFEAYATGATSQPFVAGIDADNSQGVQEAEAFEWYAGQVVGKDYQAIVQADTSPGIVALQNFASFAQQVLNGIQYALGMIGIKLGNAESRAGRVSAEIGNVRAGAAAPRTLVGSVPAPVAAPKIATPLPPAKIPVVAAPSKALGNLGKGYDDVANKASKAGDAGKKAGKDAADGANEAADAVKDYASRLKTGLTDAFDQQYGLQKATDDYYSTLNAMNKKREDELKTISELVDKQKELNIARQGDLVDARKAEIEAAISEKYGEVDRAADYRQQADEAKNAAAEKQKNIDTAKVEQQTLQDGIGKLTGYTQAAIENREAVRNLESKMLDMVVAYAATGASQEQVRAYAQGLNQQFVNDAAQVWRNRAEILNLTGDLGRYIGVVNSVPTTKATTVTANVGGNGTGAIGAMQELGRQADAATAPRTLTVALDTSAATRQLRSIEAQIKGGGSPDDPSMTAFRPGTFRNMGGIVPGYASGGLLGGTPPSNPRVDNIPAMIDGKHPAAIRSGEYIVSEPAVKRVGVGYLDAINNMKMARYNVGGPTPGANSRGNSGSNGPTLVELTAENIQAILRLADRPVTLFADAEKLASTVNEGQRVLATKGVS